MTTSGKPLSEVPADEKVMEWVLLCFFAGAERAQVQHLHPHVKLSDLSETMRAAFGKHVSRLAKGVAEWQKEGKLLTTTFSYVYQSALEDLGIDCPHVPRMDSRYYEDPRVVLECRLAALQQAEAALGSEADIGGAWEQARAAIAQARAAGIVPEEVVSINGEGNPMSETITVHLERFGAFSQDAMRVAKFFRNELQTLIPKEPTMDAGANTETEEPTLDEAIRRAGLAHLRQRDVANAVKDTRDRLRKDEEELVGARANYEKAKLALHKAMQREM